jgi:NADH-quinone oxidoreductase subunit N
MARGRRPGLVSCVAFVGLVAALAFLLPLRGAAREVFCAGTGARAAEAVNAPACAYVVDSTTLVFQLLVGGGTAVVVLVSTRGMLGTRIPTGEYHFLLLCSASGAMVLAGARDLITLVVALELVSLPAFALVGLRGRDRRAAEAALKFFLVSVVSVAVMLFGVSLVYGVTGSVYLGEIDAALRDGSGPGGVAAVGVVLTLVGLAFKVAAVPFHFWVPDTYVGAPVPVAAYLSVVSKAAGFVGLLLLVSIAFASYAGVWAPVIAVLAALTMTLGNLVALRQRNAVRLLAWSSIAQAGYLLVPLGAAATATSAAGVSSGAASGAGERSAAGAEGLLSATVAYLLIYAVVNLGAFAVVAVTARGGSGSSWLGRGSDGGASSGRGSRDGGSRDGGSRGGASWGGGRMLEDYRGMAWSRPLRACALAFFLLALAGLPPGVVGLFGKVVIFRAAIDGGVGWLAVVMAVNVVIALAYYLYWAALLFLPPESRERPIDGVGADPAPTRGRLASPWPAGVAVGLTAVVGVVLSVAPNLVLDVLDVVRLAF